MSDYINTSLQPPSGARMSWDAMDDPAPSSFAVPDGSVKITHPFDNTIIVTLNNNLAARLWLNREEAMELLEQLPSAIAQMPVSISPNDQALPVSVEINPV